MDLRRSLLLAVLVAAGCNDRKAVANMSMMVRTDDVYLIAGGAGIGASPTPLTNVSGANDNEILLNLSGATIGADPVSPRKCKDIPIYWLPTIDLENTPTTKRGDSVCGRMPQVNVGTWKHAGAQLMIFVEPDGNYRVRIDGSRLIPDAVYAVWVTYAGPSGKAYAIAPLGGVPNLLLTDDDGNGRFEHVVPTRQLKSGSLLTGAIQAEDTAHDLRIDPDTTLGFALYYYSDAQTNGNAALATKAIPPGRVAIPGATGTNAHLHLLATSKPL